MNLKQSYRKGVKIMVELGDRVADTITGFTGIVIAIVKYLNGLEKACVQSETINNGRISTEWFDVSRLIVLNKKVF